MAWSDSLSSSESKSVAASDALGSYADALAVIEAHLANAGTDALGSYSDSLVAVAYYYLGYLLVDAIPTATDGMSWEELGHLGYSDSISRIEGLLAFHSDDLNAWDDALSGFLSYLASLSQEDLNTWLDALSAVEGNVGDLIVQLVDTLAAWDDTPGGMMSHDGSITDDWSNLADRLRIYLSGGSTGVILEETHIIVGLNQMGHQGPSIGGM